MTFEANIVNVYVFYANLYPDRFVLEHFFDFTSRATFYAGLLDFCVTDFQNLCNSEIKAIIRYADCVRLLCDCKRNKEKKKEIK